MEKHHSDSIDNLVRAFQADPKIEALILGGSLAHGFARPDSDIDVSIIVSAGELAALRQSGRLHYNNRALCTYAGYIDGKYMDLDFLRLVAFRGSDPIRYAFEGARVLFSRVPGLEQLLADIVRYPVAEKPERIRRFAAQLLAWRWYYSEGVRQANAYLVTLALQKLTLFTCRLILTENEMLYPYHRWMRRVTLSAPRQPADLAPRLDALLAEHSWPLVDRHAREILAFVGLDFAATDATWPTYFMRDTELRWMTEEPAIDDL
ncbi:MAG TPA: nucleotidyltransferase domain-containing protein [Lacunisphaera sp.]|nr:nucleotidyltransferase domain-containing protein [Lacunisphaera sp.]